MASVAYKIARKRVVAVEEVVEEWKIHHEEAQAAYDVEDLVRETIDLIEPLSRLEELLQDGISPNVSTETIHGAYQCGWLLEKSIQLFSGVLFIADEIRSKGHNIEKYHDLLKAKEQAVSMKENIFRKWAIPRREVVEKAKEDFQSGNYRTL
jgi:hypothetical protein